MKPSRIAHNDGRRTIFERQGFLGPLPVLTWDQCELIVRHLNRGEGVTPAIWEKGGAITDHLFYDIATQPARRLRWHKDRSDVRVLNPNPN